LPLKEVQLQFKRLDGFVSPLPDEVSETEDMSDGGLSNDANLVFETVARTMIGDPLFVLIGLRVVRHRFRTTTKGSSTASSQSSSDEM
jgi:hypothetical protein